MANVAVSIGYGHNIGRALPRYPLSIQKVYNKYTNGYSLGIQKGIHIVYNLIGPIPNLSAVARVQRGMNQFPGKSYSLNDVFLSRWLEEKY